MEDVTLGRSASHLALSILKQVLSVTSLYGEAQRGEGTCPGLPSWYVMMLRWQPRETGTRHCALRTVGLLKKHLLAFEVVTVSILQTFFI